MSKHVLRVTIPGIPVGKGSKRHVGRGVMVESSKALAPWRADAIAHLRAAAGTDWEPWSGPISANIQFVFPRPKSHYGTGRNAGVLKASAPEWHTNKPDIDKVLRALLDAITQAGIWTDDSILASHFAEKRYGSKPMTALELRRLP